MIRSAAFFASALVLSVLALAPDVLASAVVTAVAGLLAVVAATSLRTPEPRPVPVRVAERQRR